MKLSDLQNKTIVNLIDGKNIGIIIDATVDEKGTIIDLMVEKKKFFWQIFSSKKTVYVRWENIDKIGEDVILVNIEYS